MTTTTQQTPVAGELVDTDNRFYWKEARGHASDLRSDLLELEKGLKTCKMDEITIKAVERVRTQISDLMDGLRQVMPDPVPDLSTQRAAAAAQTR